MNLNGLVLENVKESYYYKNHLVEIDTAQQLLDEVFYKVKHLEPWEKGTRKVQGMTGMCGGKEIDEKFAERKRAMLFGDGRLESRSRDRDDDRSARRRSRSRDSRSRDRKRPCSSERRHEDKRPRPTRCGHHLRHHHCTKHRKRCPDKGKEAREAKEAEMQQAAANAKDDKAKESENTTPKD
ncbi:hypothetical protein TELCIR_08895 [Teladorsagia circumcincta]|uniref:Pre-mRNA-splicing factor 38 n=1 Tax=Teladorsagia circumcincta TaxID=45464 RepID=A0A2G9UGC7_TELCI|nr:hypothetical protein TELCIR_08895 [Teladorsagia circumcincta]